jgi:hypothetical protein
MPPLHRAVTLAERDHPSVSEAEDLHLDVPGPGEIALKQDRRAGEEPLGPRPRGAEATAQLLLVSGRAHADPAAARRGLDHDRIADPVRQGDGRVLVGDRF